MAENMSEFTFEVVKKIKVLAAGAKKTKELNLVKWRSTMEPMYDIRKWEEGKPGKGISLSEEEARALYEALGAELNT